MALKETMHKLSQLLQEVSGDLVKAEKGNKAAAQRVRTGTIALEKVAKKYRKESVKAGKSKKRKTTAKKAAPKKMAAAKKAAPKRKTTAKKKSAPKSKAAPKRKTASRRRR